MNINSASTIHNPHFSLLWPPENIPSVYKTYYIDADTFQNLELSYIISEMAVKPQYRGGKTTYTQGIGIAQILAQAGLYVPGTEAEISPVDGIYSHFQIEERIDKGTGRLGDESERLHKIMSFILFLKLTSMNRLSRLKS